MGGTRTTILALVAGLAAIAVTPAYAQTDPDLFARGVDPVVFKPAAGSAGLLSLEGAKTAEQGSWRLALTSDLASGLVGLQIGDTRLGDLVGPRFDLHVLGAYAPLPGLELAIDVPVTPWQSHGFALLESETGFSEPAPASAGFGDLRLLGRWSVLSPLSASAVAVIAEARLPTGDAASFLGERAVVLAPRVAYEHRLVQGRLRLVVEGGYRWRALPGRWLNLYVGDELTFGAGGSWRLPPVAFLRGWSVFAELGVATPARAPFTAAAADALKTALEAGLGLDAEVAPGVSVRLAGGVGPAATPGYGREAFRLLASVAWRGRAAQRGLPGDRDGDLIADIIDACPDLPGSRDADGCPDRDGDQIPDGDDECPLAPGPARLAGCPAERPLALFKRGKIVLRGAITFDTGKDTIRRDSHDVLRDIVTVLQANPQILEVRVDGHTDSRGGARANLDLSRRRAEAVVHWLTQNGIAEGRLSAKGYGETEPIEPNHTPLGRARNRRVEFTIVNPPPVLD